MSIRCFRILIFGVVFAFVSPQAIAQSEFTAARQQSLAKVDIGLQYHFRRFNYESSQADPITALKVFFVPHAVPKPQVDEFEIRHAKAMRDCLIESQRLFRHARDAEFSGMLDADALQKWNRALKLFKPHNAAHLKDVRELLSAFDSDCGPAVAPKILFLGVVELVAECGRTEAERTALSTLHKQAKSDFDIAKDKIRKQIFEKMKNEIERLHYSKYVWPFDCEEERQKVNATAIAKMLAVLPAERQKTINAFVRAYGKFEQQVHARNKLLSDEVMKIDTKGARLLPVNLLITEYDPFDYVFAIGTKVRPQVSKVHYAQLRTRRKRERDDSISLVAKHLPKKHGDKFKSVMTVLDEYFVRRDAIWKPFLDNANIKTAASHFRTPEFDYHLATIASATGVSQAERSALRKLDRAIAAKHRTINSSTLKSRGWKLFYRRPSDTRPETIAFREDEQRVAMASTILRERESFERAVKLISPDKQKTFRELEQFYVKSANEFRLLLRDRISKVEAVIGSSAIRGVELPVELRNQKAVTLELESVP